MTTERPAEPSAQLLAWLGPLRNGFKPKGKVAGYSTEQLAEFFQVSPWEYLNVIKPLIAKERQPWQDESLFDGDAWKRVGDCVLKLKRRPQLTPREAAERIHEIAEQIT